MAGDWIKLEHATPDKPEIVQMAAILKLDQDAVFGKCVRLWIWADQQTVDGNALSVTESFLDRLTFCSGFAVALRQVGWLLGRDGRLTIPHFDRHNGQTAKNRAQTKARVERSRSTACNAPSVTKSLPEKRREEFSISGNDFAFSMPEQMQRADVQDAAAMWFRHLKTADPDKVVDSIDSMKAFWSEANRFGPERFIMAVEQAVSRKWKTLHYQKNDEPTDGRPRRGRKPDDRSGSSLSAVEAARQTAQRACAKFGD